MIKTSLAVAVVFSLALAGCHRSTPTVADNDSGVEMSTSDPVDYTAAQKAAIEATFPAPYNTADLADGEKQFKKCLSCHTITPDKMNLTGPHLYGVFGRKSGTTPGYPFTDAMTAHNVVWGFDTLDTYLTSPQTVVKGTKMGFQGLPDDTARHDLIAYIAVESQPHPEVSSVSSAATSSQ